MDSASGDLEGIFADMHDDTLANTNGHIDKAISPVVQNALENVEGVIDNSGVHQVEDGHHDKHIEHIREMARCSMNFVSIDVELRIFSILFGVSVGYSS